jgi:hypothetical protein
MARPAVLAHLLAMTYDLALLTELRAILGDLPEADALLRSASRDLADPGGVELWGVEDWWREPPGPTGPTLGPK